jgi:two-component system, cell cycle sensor histidine kinase and response regulator CckA
MLSAEGYRVFEAPNAEVALEIVHTVTEPITILLTDVVLPGMSGPALARRIAEQVPGVRTLFVSGYGEEDVVRQSRLPQGSTLLDKPFTRACLLDAVRALLIGTSGPDASKES